MILSLNLINTHTLWDCLLKSPADMAGLLLILVFAGLGFFWMLDGIESFIKKLIDADNDI